MFDRNELEKIRNALIILEKIKNNDHKKLINKLDFILKEIVLE